ncbi:MAG: CDP-glycerol glycerophosphotransferase family protein [Blautia caecimuris]|nr:hypothetical protein [Blautia caecimuris]
MISFIVLYTKLKCSKQDITNYYDLPRDRCTEEEQLIELIKEYAANDFREKKCYSDMNQKYFAYHDRNNCKRTYKFILKNCQK